MSSNPGHIHTLKNMDLDVLEEKSEHEEDGDKGKDGNSKSTKTAESLSHIRSGTSKLPPIQQSATTAIMSSNS